MNIAGIIDELSGMTVIITGGNKGIGEGCARAFCECGASVIIGARDAEAGAAVAEGLTVGTPGRCEFFKCDVSDGAQIEALIEFAVQRFGGLDCMINNAGFLPRRRPIDEMSEQDMLDAMRINMLGVFSGCKYALPYLRASKGSIINMSSVLGRSGQEGSALYAATKGAIIAFTKSLACDEARHGVRVNVLCPGDVRSELNNGEAQNTAHKVQSGIVGRYIHLIQRRGEPEEIGTACLFLASSWASFITGSELYVDGGFFAGNGIKAPQFDWSGVNEIHIK